MISKPVKSALENLGMSKDKIKKLSELDDMHNQLLEIRTTMLTYANCHDDLAKSATKLNNIYEYFIGHHAEHITEYFENCYKNWICLVLRTEDGEVYDYTKRNLVMAFRGMDVHNLPPQDQGKLKYLVDFLEEKNHPTVLFYENWKKSYSIENEHSGKFVINDQHEINFRVDLKLNLKESIILGIFTDLWTVPGMSGNAINPDRSIRDVEDYSLINTHAQGLVDGDKKQKILDLVDRIKKQNVILHKANETVAARRKQGVV